MMLEGDERRQEILKLLSSHATPVNGSELAKAFGVSRQIIVQDIALLRAANRDILSTNKGYILHQTMENFSGVQTVVCVKHSLEQTMEEMQIILDYGGSMLDVSIDHDLYGHIRADLVINSVADATEFCNKMKQSTSKPLKVLTDDCHYHTITAPSGKALQMILSELKEKQFLL